MGGDSETNAPRVAPLRQLKEACASLRNTLKELEASHAAGKIDKAQLKQQRWQAVVLLSAMKAGLRDTFLAGDEWKTRVQDQKDVVEAHQLQLQNLLYEKDHLVREIRRCKGFHTSEMDRIEFEGGSIPIVVDADVHRQHLDQLTQELETRKRMVAQVKDVKAKIEIVEAATQRKQVFLDGLRGQLDQIEASTSGLQSHMQTPVTATLKLQHEASAALAAPLYTLFCELQAYEKASGCAKQMQVSIVDAKGLGSKAGRVKKREFPGALLAGGRVHTDSIEPPPSKRLKAPSRSPSVAKQRESRKTPSRSPSMSRTRPVESGEILVGDAVAVDKEEEGAIAEPTPRGMPALIIKEMSEVKIANDDDNEGVFDEDRAADSQPKELWKCADKAVQLTLSLAVDDNVEGAETKEFAVLFQYFPTAQIVTAELVTPTSSSLGKHVLTSLFPGDNGLQLSNHATAYKFTSEDESQSEVSFPFELTASRPYLWAQWICGLHALPRSDASESQRRPEPSVRNVIQQLIRRLTATTQLKRHLGALAKGDTHAPVHASFARHFPTTINTKLSEWKEITHPTADTRDLFKSHASTGNQYFSVAFKNDKLHVDAVIEVSPEYPVRAPQFRLRHGESTGTVDNALKEIELEVNTYYNELVARHCDQFLLAHQLRKVQQCVDVLSAGSAGNLPTCFGRARRGKDRRPALVVDPVTKEVRHR